MTRRTRLATEWGLCALDGTTFGADRNDPRWPIVVRDDYRTERGKGERDVTTRICETRRRPGVHAAAHRARVAAEPGRLPRVVAKPETHASLLDDVLTAIRHLDGTALATRSRRRLPGWNPRDRRVQRLRGWLSGAPG